MQFATWSRNWTVTNNQKTQKDKPIMTYKLLSVGNDAKTIKGQKKGVLTGILYMAPHTIAGGASLCPFSTAGCRAVCLYSAGRGGFNVVQQARIRKSRAFQADPDAFIAVLVEDIKRLVKDAEAKGFVPAVRLNGTTDILWEKLGIIEQFPGVPFYDYTKYPAKLRGKLPANYHLTFSFSEKEIAGQWSDEWAELGVNTAVVFHGALPETFRGRPVINGDESDLRFTDAKGVIVGLKTKGKARSSEVGEGFFVQAGKVAA